MTGTVCIALWKIRTEDGKNSRYCMLLQQQPLELLASMSLLLFPWQQKPEKEEQTMQLWQSHLPKSPMFAKGATGLSLSNISLSKKIKNHI